MRVRLFSDDNNGLKLKRACTLSVGALNYDDV